MPELPTGTVAFLLRIEGSFRPHLRGGGELTAGGLNVTTARQTDRRWQVRRRENRFEGGDRFRRARLIVSDGADLGRIEGDQVPIECGYSEEAKELLPQSIIARAPSAELGDKQLDEDSPPPYPKLDEVLKQYVEHDGTLEELSEYGSDKDVVERAVSMIGRAEYERRQARPGVKLRPKAFGCGRHRPITNRWRG